MSNDSVMPEEAFFTDLYVGIRPPNDVAEAR